MRLTSADRKIIGGSACEYYPKSNCGLLTYFAVRPEWQRRYVHHLNALAADPI